MAALHQFVRMNGPPPRTDAKLLRHGCAVALCKRYGRAPSRNRLGVELGMRRCVLRWVRFVGSGAFGSRDAGPSITP